MNGLELSREYWAAVARPALEKEFPELLTRVAVGLVGNGSECFGYDDLQSRDHDWGVDFFLWVTQADKQYIPVLRQWKQNLMAQNPPVYVRNSSHYGAAVDVMSAEDFYQSLIGCPGVPDDILKWRWAPEENYALATNGEVFWDGSGEFSAVRKGLLDYYPEDLRRKKIAARCMAIAQTGQYNFQRIAARGDWVTVRTVLDKFTCETMGLVFHLNRVFRPYYKWTWRKLGELPVLGQEVSQLLLQLAQTQDIDERARRVKQQLMDEICGLLADQLRQEGLSDCPDLFLAGHGEAVQRTIRHERLRKLPVQYE